MSGGELKGGGDGVSMDCPGSPPLPPPAAPPSMTSASGRMRSLQKRVVTVPLADMSIQRPNGVGEGNKPTDSLTWRKYGQKPIKGSPFPRVYYRCSSSKGCPARKQVERSRGDPDMLLVTYCYEHNHSNTEMRAQNRQDRKPKAHPGPPEPSDSDLTHTSKATVAAGGLVSDGLVAAAIEVHDEFRWLYDVVSVTSSTSSSDSEAANEMLLYGPMFFGVGATIDTAALLPNEFGDTLGGLGGDGSEEDAMFEGLGELPECAVVFRRHAGDGMGRREGSMLSSSSRQRALQ